MARESENYDPVINSTDVYYQYQTEAILQDSVTILPAAGSSNITTIIAGGGGSVTGPTVTLTTTLSGLAFVAAGTTLTLQGTLGIANGGTGATTAAAARTALGLGTAAVLNSPIPVANGGTAGTTAATARANLSVPQIVTAVVAPTVNDDSGDGFAIGDFWVDTVTDTGYQVMDVTVGAAVWKQVTA